MGHEASLFARCSPTYTQHRYDALCLSKGHTLAHREHPRTSDLAISHQQTRRHGTSTNTAAYHIDKRVVISHQQTRRHITSTNASSYHINKHFVIYNNKSNVISRQQTRRHITSTHTMAYHINTHDAISHQQTRRHITSERVQGGAGAVAYPPPCEI